MKTRIEIASAWLPLPPSSNNSYVNLPHGRAKSQALKDWENQAGWVWRIGGTMPKEPLREKQAWGWSSVFYFPDHLKRDMDNHIKHIQDLIVTVVFGGKPDDRHVAWMMHEKHLDKKNPGVQVTVYEIAGVIYDGVVHKTRTRARPTGDPVAPGAD